MNRVEFDAMCLEYPDLREVITELVSHRISGSKLALHRTVGKFVITQAVGEGGWATVYKGVHESLNMPVAIKMLKHSMAMDPDFMEKFLNEAKVIARLNHPNIVRIHDIEHMYRTVFIVMEYLSGLSLEYVLQNMPPLDLGQIIDYLTQVACGLEYAHNQGIIHQDIKPANIFIETGDRVKIVDFGLACPTGAGDETDMPGTPHYMAPEQINGDPVDARTDIYSLGITAYEMVVGQRPFAAKSVAEVFQAHQEEPVPETRFINPTLPAELDEFIQRATRKEPRRRYSSAASAIEDLSTLAGHQVETPRPKEEKTLRNLVLLTSYRDEDHDEMTQLVEEFRSRVSMLGADLNVASFD